MKQTLFSLWRYIVISCGLFLVWHCFIYQKTPKKSAISGREKARVHSVVENLKHDVNKNSMLSYDLRNGLSMVQGRLKFLQKHIEKHYDGFTLIEENLYLNKVFVGKFSCGENGVDFQFAPGVEGRIGKYGWGWTDYD